MFYFFLRFQAFFAELVGTCFLLLWKNVPIFSSLILLQPSSGRFLSEFPFAARDISLRPLIPRGSPVIDLGVKATNSDYDSRGGFLSKIRWRLLSVHVKTIQIFGTTTILLHILYMYIYIYKYNIYIHFKEVMFRQIRKPNSQTQGKLPLQIPVQLPFSYFTEMTQGNFRALRRPEAANGR